MPFDTCLYKLVVVNLLTSKREDMERYVRASVYIYIYIYPDNILYYSCKSLLYTEVSNDIPLSVRLYEYRYRRVTCQNTLSLYMKFVRRLI